MIGKLMTPFASETSLCSKIDYNIKKLEEGKATFLFDNTWKNDIYQLFQSMKDVGFLNDRTNAKYNEVILSLAPGEQISDEKFKELAIEYMTKLGYEDSCYNIWRHSDKDHPHVHILFTTIDFNGEWIQDNYSHLRAQKLSRELEMKYGLQKVEYHKFSNEPLSAVKAREYYFDNALKKGIKGYNTKDALRQILEKNNSLEELKCKHTNKGWMDILGKESYESIGEILEKSNLLKKLYKDELVAILDNLYDSAGSKEDFFKRIESVDLYVRMVSQKGKHAYVYGIPDANVYFQDKQLPLRFRYENICNYGQRNYKDLLESEQKNRIYNKVFIALKNSSDFGEFAKELAKLNVTLIQNKNEGGVYGLSFQLIGIKDPKVFKASEVSRKLSYANIVNYFEGLNKPLVVLLHDSPNFVMDLQNNESVYEGIPIAHQQEDNEEYRKKKKKRKKGRDQTL